MNTEQQQLARDAQRDIGAELLQSVRQMKTGKTKPVTKVRLTAVAEARLAAVLSQS